MKITLEKRILLFAFLALTLAIGINTGFNIQEFRRNYRDSIILRCRSLATGLEMSIEKVLALGVPLDEMEGINARCQEIVATDPEICYCLVENDAGQPLYSSDPSFNLAKDGQFVAQHSEATTVLEFPQWGKVFDFSAEIHSLDDQTAGRVRIGFPAKVLDDHVAKVFQRSFLILGAAFLILFSLVAIFIRRDLVAPIKKLCSVAREIAGGNFTVGIPPMPTKDFADLAQALGEMAESLNERDERIQESYHELEETNLLLQKSYEQQEQISSDLKRSREMYRVLFDNASDAIVVSDQDDRIILFNKQAEEFFGISRDRVVGENLFKAIDLVQGDLDQHYRFYQKLLEKGFQEEEFDFVQLADHRPVAGLLRASVARGNQGKFWVQTVIRDVTRETETRRNLEKSTRELERLNQMKDSFLGVVSHELKTPLTVIIGYSDLILAEMPEKVDPSVLAMIRHVAEAGERLSDIVRDMLDVSMLDRRRVYLCIQPVDINDLVRSASREFDVFFLQRRQSLELKLEPRLPEIQGDPERLFQALSNLLSNAVKFTPDGGRIAIETRIRESLRSAETACENGPPAGKIECRPSPYIEIIVRDSGIGITESDQRQVFEKFFEVGKIEEHFTGKMAFKGKGTGLGLTIAKGIINMHGGEIWVESSGYDPRTCPGSSFHILLPLPPDPKPRTMS